MSVQKVLWYSLTATGAIKQLNSAKIGLTSDEAAKRLESFGLNQIPKKKRTTQIVIFLRQFKSILVGVLGFAAITAAFLTEWVDFTVVVAAILINVIVGFIQETKAERALEKLQEVVSYTAKVYRDGLLKQIPAEELVPGDVIILEAGDQVPADVRIIDANNLSCSEAILTGESNAVNKSIKKLVEESGEEILVADRINMAFDGTLVAEGKGLGLVVATGKDTELGKIANLLATTKDEKTPLQIKLQSFSRKLVAVILAIAFIILVVGLLRGLEFWEIFFVALAAAVSAVPEGLLVAVTVILAIGMQRILKKKALVRQLLAAETLGSTTVVCVDKTGTITEGHMVAQKLVSQTHVLDFTKDSTVTSEFEKAIKMTLLCNNAVIEEHGDEPKIIGSPTERAILKGSLRGEIDEKTLVGYTRVHEVPFTSKTKSMYTLNSHDKELLWCGKGAPELMLAKCDRVEVDGKIIDLNDKQRKEWLKRFDSYSTRGFRLLASVYKKTNSTKAEGYTESNFVFLGLWVIADPIRPGIAETIALAKQAGIRTIMITGDHKLTAKEVARQIGLKVSDTTIIDGNELLALSDAELKQKVKKVTVFARVSPHDKLKIVNALQSHGEVVAMTGDGINDAPALKTADIGIAVAAGTDVTKQTADIVLLDNNFKTIIAAVEQGRIIFANIKKVIVYLLADSFSELLLILGALLFGLPLPITAAQILWINLITDGFPAAALTLEEGEPGAMKQKPIKRNAPIMDREMKALIFIIGLFADALLFSVFFWLNNYNFDIEYIRSIVFVGVGINSLLYVFSCKSLTQPLWKIKVFGNKMLLLGVGIGLVLQVLPLYAPLFQKLFKLVPLGLYEWTLILSLAFLQVTLIEVTKYLFYPPVKSYGKA